MSPLQWSLLILGAAIIAFLLYSSWRERKLRERPKARPEDPKRPRFGQDYDPAARRNAEGFDEFGVSRPRRLGGPDEDEGPAGDKQENPARAEPAAAGAEQGEPDADDKQRPGKLIAFYIAEHEGTAILGPKIHESLKRHGLEFGAKKIYHRMNGGRPVFSVASLTKPGTLDPGEAEGFSTPGLSVFLQLPAPIAAIEAFSDMLHTARVLAQDLKAEVFDTEEQAVLTPERERELRQQVREFAHQHGV